MFKKVYEKIQRWQNYFEELQFEELQIEQ